MGYISIECLYKHQDVISQFPEWWALEKVHGTSAHLELRDNADGADSCGALRFFSGGAEYKQFRATFDERKILENYRKLRGMLSPTAAAETKGAKIIIYGEAYGGKMQKMMDTYGTTLKFIAFDVKVGDCWLPVLAAVALVEALGLEFVPFRKIPSTIEALNRERDADSEVAVRNGMGLGKLREGVVIRPVSDPSGGTLEPLNKFGERIIYKHKRAEFSEHKSPKELGSATHDGKQLELGAISGTKKLVEIADDWVTVMRLEHVLDKLSSQAKDEGKEEKKVFPDQGPSWSQVIDAMVEDVRKESKGEFEMTLPLIKLIKQNTTKLYAGYKKNQTK